MKAGIHLDWSLCIKVVLPISPMDLVLQSNESLIDLSSSLSPSVSISSSSEHADKSCCARMYDVEQTP